MIPKDGKIIILSGSIESGKTTLCLRFFEYFRTRGLDIKGLICPPVIEGGMKTGIDLLNTATGEQRRLAVLRNGTAQGVLTERWQFNENTLEWGNAILKNATPCDILFVDELGLLEFERGEGWQNGLSAVDSRAYKLAVVIVRPALVEQACRRWPDAEVIPFTRQDQDRIFDQVLNVISPFT